MVTTEEIIKTRNAIKQFEIEGKKISDDPKWNTPEGDELLNSINEQWKAAKEKLAQMLKEAKEQGVAVR